MRVALSIAGSDPTGGAGLQADLQVFRALGVHGAGVPTALTVQDTARVHRVLPVFPTAVFDQIRIVARDLEPDAVKIGMLATDDIARQVARALESLPGGAAAPPVVIDPVLAASDGSALLERRAWPALCEMIGRAEIATPNLPEASALSGRDVSSDSGVEAAARFFVEDLGARAALVKGGHAEGPPRDLLCRREHGGTTLVWLESERAPGGPVHGTGCALAAAIAAHRARGTELAAAVDAARRFVADAIRRAEPRGAGGRLLGFGASG